MFEFFLKKVSANFFQMAFWRNITAAKPPPPIKCTNNVLEGKINMGHFPKRGGKKKRRERAQKGKEEKG